MKSIFRGLKGQLWKQLGVRRYGTRSINDSPFDHLPKRHSKWINWKTTGFFFVLGSAAAYNEVLFNMYERFTAIDENDYANTELLPRQLEYKLKQLPIYQELTHPKNSTKWYKLESWENLDRNILDKQDRNDIKPEKVIKNQADYHKPSLTNTIAKPGGILIKPVIFFNIDTNESVTIVHVGHRLTGYPFLVHGGIIATLLNETFKRNASLTSETKSNLRDDFKVENLTINYYSPTFSNQFLIVKTKQKPGTTCDDKKTINLVSTLESQTGTVCVKGSALLHDTGRATNALKAENKKWKLF